MAASEQLESRGGERLILNFHGLGAIPPHVGLDERRYWVSESKFACILDEIVQASGGAGPSFQITFDDGNETDASVALPALVQRGLIADFFICAGRIGRPGYLDETQLLQLSRAGMGIGSHGWGHVDWRRADDDAIDKELRVARARLLGIVGHDVPDVAIPFNSYDRRVIGQLRRNGIRRAYTSEGGRASGHEWLVPRVSWLGIWDDATIRRLASTPPTTREKARRSLVRLAKRLL